MQPKEAYTEWKNHHPGAKVSFSRFASLRPRECIIAGARGTHSVVMELLAYMADIHKASQEFVGTAWVQYDATFQKQAASSGNRRWSCLTASLYPMSFTGRATSGKYCELCFSTAHVTRECSLAADHVDVAYEWRMVKSVVASLSGSSQESQPAVVW